ncbi:MAG TPA: ABC transporter ATP-binding protein [Stackebrandtia sp.]|jgi:iron complex transport system ATP-binding protein|uniref:ABC transporter ATP-binding protein n=1 Tax=Stackebrandtia sp. TaxID=2023065 RepID=UPI002D759403|nr:ABC transporter ATP-binding protein [Stackebrandtia sp.]HZE40513.1 ABC transporter ATP-binding protein [Stackebrandtia sp.]
MSELSAAKLSLGYGNRRVLSDLDVVFPPRRVTAIVGPNACGKSTLLRGLARVLPCQGGTVTIDGEAVAAMKARRLAQRLGMLPQHPVNPDGVSVEALVRLGRYPHQRPLRAWSARDQAAVESAMDATGVTALRDRPVDELSGGQRQRAWIALALAQQTPLLLLDEPTSFLDLRHQIEVLDLLTRLNTDDEHTIVMVLHDLGQAARYADHLVVMAGGEVVAAGEASAVLTSGLISRVFEVDCRVIDDPETGTPLVIPRAPVHRQPSRPR